MAEVIHEETLWTFLPHSVYAMGHSTRAAHAACYVCANLSVLMSETCFGHNCIQDLSTAS